MHFLKRLLLLFYLISLPFCGRSQTDSFNIYFETGLSAPDAMQLARIDSLLYAGAIPGNASIYITGYADEPGGAPLNKSIAGKRAAAVRAYLLSSGVAGAAIAGCRGAGNIVRTGNDALQRRVTIVWRKRRAGERADRKAGPAAAVDSATIPPPRKPRKLLAALGGMKPDELLVIDNLMFKLSSSVFVESSYAVLDELVQVLQDYPKLKIRLEGHICCGGNDATADKLQVGYSLSVDRAKAVNAYLVRHGIAADRISFAGFGFSRPKVFPEKTRADSDLNRRVEIRVVSNK